MKNMKKAILSILILLVGLTAMRSQTITIKMSGIKNTTGNIRLAFFTCEKEYKTEIPKITRYISKKDVKNGCLTATFTDIPPGSYGIALLDDENKNGKMDYSFFIPTEGFGFSNYYHEGYSKPNFTKFSFNLGSSDRTITIKTRYM